MLLVILDGSEVTILCKLKDKTYIIYLFNK